MDGSSEGLTIAGSLACRQQLIGPPQAIASDILLELLRSVTVRRKLERNLDLDNEIMTYILVYRVKQGQRGWLELMESSTLSGVGPGSAALCGALCHSSNPELPLIFDHVLTFLTTACSLLTVHTGFLCGSCRILAWNTSSQCLPLVCVVRGLCACGPREYIGRAVFFMYPYVFVAGPNKHDVILVSHLPMRREITAICVTSKRDAGRVSA